jgi:hypothetical protein
MIMGNFAAVFAENYDYAPGGEVATPSLAWGYPSNKAWSA